MDAAARGGGPMDGPEGVEFSVLTDFLSTEQDEVVSGDLR